MDPKIIVELAGCVGMFLLFMVPGVILKKTKLVSDRFAKDTSNMILYIAQPILIFLSCFRTFDADVAKRAGLVFILAMAAHIIFFLISLLFFHHAPPHRQSVLRFSIVFSNAGFMGIPLIEATFGNEAVIYASIYVMAFQLFLWTLGCYLYTGDKKYFSVKKVFLNPSTIATVLGLVVFFTSFSDVIGSNNIVYETLDKIKGVVAPLSMFVIGFRLADLFKDLKKVFNYRFPICIALRLLLCPFVMFLILFLLTKVGICTDEISTAVVLISSATPIASATSMLAEKFDGDALYAGTLVSVSTILSVLTIPLIAYLLVFL